DCIHEKHKKTSEEGIDCLQLWKRLIGEEQVKLAFYRLKSSQDPDELYIKLNGRGRALTDFEKFKSWLVGYVKSQALDVRANADWEELLDGKWTDLFWQYQ